MSAELWPVDRKVRVISDNDYSGDPDGLVQLAHHLLSQTVDLRAIIGTHLREGDSWNGPGDSAANAVIEANKIVELCGRTGEVPVLKGSSVKIKDVHTPAQSDGIDFIIKEAMRDDTDLPLYVVCGASLTEIASAYLIEPRIADRLTVVWIGGHEHEGLAVPPPGGTDIEYNLHQDIDAGQVVFNHSNLKLWQVPRDRYRQVLASRAELLLRMANQGPLGAHLFESLARVNMLLRNYGMPAGEVYALGDSPLVLLTALQVVFEPDPSSSEYQEIACPTLLPTGLYEPNPNGRKIRVYTLLDNRLLLEDLYAKLELHSKGIK